MDTTPVDGELRGYLHNHFQTNLPEGASMGTVREQVLAHSNPEAAAKEITRRWRGEVISDLAKHLDGKAWNKAQFEEFLDIVKGEIELELQRPNSSGNFFMVLDV